MRRFDARPPRAARALLLAARLAGAVAVCCALSACERVTAVERAASARAEVQGGTETGGDHAYTVALENTAHGSFCSGTLVAPNLVLTARHCVARATSRAIECSDARFTEAAPPSRIRVTTDARPRRTSSRYYTGAELFVPDDVEVCGNDIALVVLEEAIARSEAIPATPLVFGTMTDRAQFSAEYTSIGYGTTGPRAEDPGTRRKRERIPIACIAREPAFPCPSAFDGLIGAREFLGMEGVCQGDSGGGAFDQKAFDRNTPLVLGVLSRGSEEPSTGRCVQPIFTRTDAFRDLLLRAATRAAHVGGYGVPSWSGDVGNGEPHDGDRSPGDPPTARGADEGSSRAELGTECRSDDACRSGLCRAPSASTQPTCTARCGPESPCPPPFVCERGLCSHEAPAGMAPRAEGARAAGTGCAAAPGMAGKRSPHEHRRAGDGEGGGAVRMTLAVAVAFAAARLVRRRRPKRADPRRVP
jgi:hypothetical protein